MQIDNDRLSGIIAITGMVISNIAGDIISISVLNGGMFAVALSTSISVYLAVFIIFLRHYTKKDIMLKFSIRLVHPGFIVEIIKNGLPYAILNASIMIQRIALNYLLLNIAGQWSVSTFGTTCMFFGFLNSVMIGVGQATLLVAGIAYGEEDKNALRVLLNISLKLITISMTVLGMIILLFTPLFVNIFMDKTVGETYDAAMIAFRTNAVGLPFMGINVVFIMYLQGVENLFLSRLISFFDKALYIVGICVLLGMIFGTDGVWYGMMISEFLVLFTILIYANFRKEKAGSFVNALVFLPEGFGVSDDDQIEFTMSNMNDVIKASESARHFVMDRGGSKRDGLMLALCIEEMAGNIIRYGYSDEKHYNAEIKLMKKDSWVIRIKDDCIPFDPFKWLELHNADDRISNIGIRMVTAIAKDFSYLNTMRLNSLLISI